MGYSIAFQYMRIMYNDEIGVIGICITSNIYDLFLLETYKILSSSYFEIFR